MEDVRSFVFVTGNRHKLEVVKALLSAGDSGIQVTSQALENLPEVQGTTIEVAKAKCRAAALQIGGPCVTEDSSLAFEALGGLPGPYIKDFMDAVGLEGLNKMLVGFPSKSATAICTFAYSSGPGAEPLVFEGKTDGKIVSARRGQNVDVFGWDPIFQPNGYDVTYAEMHPIEKNKISHTDQALTLLKAHLLSL